MILLTFRHGLRASEVCGLQWSDVEFESGTLHLRRAKGGSTSTHPLLGDELRALRALKREAKSPFIFVSERGAPFSTSGLAKLIERAGIEAKLPFKVHPHMLRHATGFALAIRERTQERCKPTLVIAAFNRLSATLSWHQVGEASPSTIAEPIAQPSSMGAGTKFVGRSAGSSPRKIFVKFEHRSRRSGQCPLL
jgi:hypothetical protein